MSYNINSANTTFLAMPVGCIVAWISTLTIPSGWAICNGQAYNTSTNPILFAMLGSSALPDLRGSFLRQTGANTVNSVSYSGPALKGVQQDDYKAHTHPVNDPTHSHTYLAKTSSTAAGSGGTGLTYSGTLTTSTVSLSSFITVESNSADTETAPYCYGINWIIKLG
jgi:microcystin-dependent protein